MGSCIPANDHYPTVAEAIREAQGRSSRAQRDVKQQDLLAERERNRTLRQEIEELRTKVASLASINEVLMSEARVLKAKQSAARVIDLPSGKL